MRNANVLQLLASCSSIPMRNANVLHLLLFYTSVVLALVEQLSRPDTVANARGSVRSAIAIAKANITALVDRKSTVCLGQLGLRQFHPREMMESIGAFVPHAHKCFLMDIVKSSAASNCRVNPGKRMHIRVLLAS